ALWPSRHGSVAAEVTLGAVARRRVGAVGPGCPRVPETIFPEGLLPQGLYAIAWMLLVSPGARAGGPRWRPGLTGLPRALRSGKRRPRSAAGRNGHQGPSWTEALLWMRLASATAGRGGTGRLGQPEGAETWESVAPSYSQVPPPYAVAARATAS